MWQPGDRLTCLLGLGREHRSGRTGGYAGAPREAVPDGLLLYLYVRSSSFVVLRFPYAELADDENSVARVLTDNGSCYRSRAFTAAHGESITHKFTRPYRLQTNGKVESFNRTLAQEWAYAETYLSDEARAATYQAWIHSYSHHRPRTGIGGKSPTERVHNAPGNYS